MSKVPVTTYRSIGYTSSEPTWLMALLSFLMGLILCQIVSGDERIPSTDFASTPKKLLTTDEEPVQVAKEQPHSSQRPELLLLGGEAGFGTGTTIGSGVAEILINHETPTNESNDKDEPQDKGAGSKHADARSQLIPSQQVPSKKVPTQDLRVQPVNYRNWYNRQGNQTDDQLNFGTRRRGAFAPVESFPEPLGFGAIYDPERIVNPWHPNTRKDEAVFNGGDQGKRATVDSSWNVYNLNPEDTIGHFDTLDGRRLVTPSNRVAIYAPRFAAVRKLDGVINSETRLKVGSMDEKKVLNVSESQDFSSTTKQHLSLDRYQGSKRASGFRENTRGVTSDNVTQLFGARNTFDAFENLSLFRIGMHQNSESARLGLGMQSANVWQDNLGVQVSVKGAQPVIVNDVYKVQQIVRIDSDNKQTILRVCKVASKISARPGEPVDFSIRFDNLTGRAIGNVTIIDNLANRLDYVPESAECSLKSNFSFERNEVGSLILRWEIVDAMPANTGGIIRFRCRVR